MEHQLRAQAEAERVRAAEQVRGERAGLECATVKKAKDRRRREMAAARRRCVGGRQDGARGAAASACSRHMSHLAVMA